MAKTYVSSSALSGNNSHNSQHILATLDNGKPVYNRAAIMRRAWQLYRTEQKDAAVLTTRGHTIQPLSLGDCMKQAWTDARGVVSSLRYSASLKKAPEPVRRVINLRNTTRLGVQGFKLLGDAIAESVRATV